MIAFLKTATLERPALASSPPRDGLDRVGILSPTTEEGSVLLKSKDGGFHRLSWKKGDADRRRSVPPGEYTLIGYTLTAWDKQGKEWYASASGKMIRKLAIRAGEEQKLELPQAVHLQVRASVEGDTVQVQMKVQGEHHCGLTLYREGKRILVGCRVLDSKGLEQARGQMEYG